MNSTGRLLLLLAGVATAAPAQLTFERRTIPAATPAITSTVADFNGDRRLDVAVITINGTVNLYLGRGDGTFEGAAWSRFRQRPPG
jgi:hypothetical protein